MIHWNETGFGGSGRHQNFRLWDSVRPEDEPRYVPNRLWAYDLITSLCVSLRREENKLCVCVCTSCMSPISGATSCGRRDREPTIFFFPCVKKTSLPCDCEWRRKDGRLVAWFLTSSWQPIRNKLRHTNFVFLLLYDCTALMKWPVFFSRKSVELRFWVF